MVICVYDKKYVDFVDYVGQQLVILLYYIDQIYRFIGSCEGGNQDTLGFIKIFSE